MAGKRVPVLDPDGVFGTVDEADVPNLPLGARVLSKQQEAERAADEAYDSKSTAEKVGSIASVAGPLPFAARAGYKLATGQGGEIVPSLPPAVESYAQGVSGSFAGGVPTLAMRELARVGGGDEGAKKYVETIDTAKEANPLAHGAGAVAGLAGGVVAGGSGGLAKAIPGAGISAAGGALEAATAKALGGLASKGALGRAATTGASLAVRGAFEGGAFAGAEQASENMLHDTPVFGEKLYSAIGNGALLNGGLGGILGAGGSLVASGARGARASLLTRGLAEETPPLAAARSEAPALSAGEAQPTAKARGPLKKSGVVDTDAGLRTPGPEATRAVDVGAVKGGGPSRDPGLNIFDPGGFKPRATGDVSFRGGDGAIADAGLKDARPFDFSNFERPAGEAAGVAPKPTVGASAPEVPAAKVPEVPVAPGKKLGLLDLLSNPRDAARGLAQDQAAQAIMGGFGLQSTRYAKQAAKFFPNGTRDLGEIALRHGIVDVSETASPLEAAWKAAQTGTPAEMLPKIQAASDSVGEKIGAITDASGATVPVKDLQSAIAKVRNAEARIAGREHVVNALDQYEASLVEKLGGPKAEARVQDVLEQRKGLDKIVYEEARTLDPKGRVAALRDVRSGIEGVVTDALDTASGKVKGELASQYKTLKKDFHGLRILQEAAEDSAARSAKASSLGLGEKFAVGMSLATGHIASAPMLALGGKVLRERGNAAAAAFLTRMADTGTLESIVSRFDRRVAQAAAGALHEAPSQAKSAGPAKTGAKAAASVEEAKAATREVQKKGSAIVKWLGELRADPSHFSSQLEDHGTVVGRAAGSNAADAYTTSTLRAIQFISSFVPDRERRDPLDPRSVPPLTYDEADRLVRATNYAARPETVWADFGRGKITPEGLRAAQEFQPTAFGEFQEQLREHVESHMRDGKQLSATQRLRIDKLLGSPAGADLRPAALARLQANLQPALPEPPPANGTTTGKPVDLKVQQTGFDAIEARKAG